MKATILPTCALLISGIAASAFAAPPAASTAYCARIADVSVPAQVDVRPAAIVFTGNSGRVEVTDSTITANGKTFRDPSVKGYYLDMRQFLGNASNMANVAKHFTQREAFPQAATSMCQAILAVHASGQRMQLAFAGFVSPVQVTLKPDRH